MNEPTPRSIKRALRRAMVPRILALEPAERDRQTAELIARFENLPGLSEAGTVLLYVSAFPEELQTWPLLVQILDSGRTLVCPRVASDRKRLSLHPIRNPQTDFEPGALKIPEPSAMIPELDPDRIDWVLVPGLAFEPRGYRLGRGAGYYDRLLPRLRPEVPRWSLIFEPQWVESLPVEPHDQRLDGIVSPSRLVTTDRLASLRIR